MYTSVIFANGMVYLGSQDASLYAPNASDGSFSQVLGTNVRFATDGQVNSTPLVVPLEPFQVGLQRALLRDAIHPVQRLNRFSDHRVKFPVPLC